MPGEILKRVEDSKVGRFIASIPSNGQGLLHLVEDVETGFVMAFPSLKGWALATQDVIDGIDKGVKDAQVQSQGQAHSDPIPQAPAPVTPPPTATPAEPAPAPTGALATAGVDNPTPANAAPSAAELSGTGLDS